VNTPEGAPVLDIVSALRRGEVVALPTDTVYGVGVLASDRDGAARVFALKGRPDDVPLPVLVADLEDALALAPLGLESLRRLGEALWPGALTVVVARREGIDWELGGDGATIGIRCPDHDLLRAVLRETGPLAVSSANRHGEPPATTPEEVRRSLGVGVPCLDGGRCDRQPSTVVELVEDSLRCLREGAVAFEDVRRALAATRGRSTGT